MGVRTYLVAVGATVLVGVIRFLLHGVLGDVSPFLPFVLAVGVAASYGGLRPGLLATALSAFAAVFLFTPPLFTPWVDTFPEGVGLALFAVIGVLISWLCEGMHRARQRIESQNARLEAEITERVKAEQAERDQRELLRTTLASIGDAVIATDTEGRITTMNAVAESLTGWRTSDATGQPLDAVFRIANETTRMAVENPVERVLREGVIVGLANHTVLIARDGTELPIYVSAAPIRDAAEKMIGVVLTFRDVAEQRKAEQELGKSEAELADFFENATVGLHWIGADGIILRANRAELDMLGYSKEEYVGRHIADFHADEDVICDILERLRDEERLIEYPARLKCKDGSIKDVLIDSSVLWNDGRFVHTRCFTRDVTERKRAADAEAERSRLTALRADVSTALAAAQPTQAGLQGCCEALVRHLGVSFARIWTHNEAGGVLELQASAGQYTHIDGPHSRIKVGEFKIGRIAHSRRPHLTNDVPHDPNISDRTWAEREGVVAFAGYPLVVDDRVVGVVAMFARRPLTGGVLTDLAPLAEGVAQYIDRRQADAGREQSEERYRNLMDQAPFSIQVFSPDGRTNRVNRAWEELWGVTLDQIDDYNILEDQQLEAKGLLPLIKQAFAGEPTFIPAIKYDPNETIPGQTRHDDPVRWVAAVAYPLKDDAGKIREVVLVHDDVTARRKAEAALRESEEKLRLLVDTIPQLAWMARPDGHIFWYNRRWYEYTGTTPDEMEGWGWQSVHDPEVLPIVLDRWQGSIASGEPFDMVFPLRGEDKQFRPFLTRVNPLRDEQGGILYWFGTNTDISEQKRGEETARFVAEVSAALAELTDPVSTLQRVASMSVPSLADWCAVDVVEDGGKLRRVAVVHTDPVKLRAYRELIERYPPRIEDPHGIPHVLRMGEPDLLEDIPDSQLVSVAHDEEHLRLLRAMGLKSQILVPIRSHGRTLGGLTFITAESGRRYTRADSQVVQDLAHRVADAIERADLYAALREADRRKDEFLATLAHELRNPLAPIRSGLEIIRLSGDNGIAVGQARSMMERQLSQMVRLVDDLLDVSRISRGKLELRKEQVDLALVVNNAVETSRPVIEAGGHELTVVLPPTPVVVDADVTRLGQVFANLLNNASKYSEPGGHIRLAAECQGGEVVVSVKDTGVGIPPAMLPRVFDLFTQVDRSLEKAQGGLGIGLTLVKRLVEMHGGSIEATSDGHGMGSEFVVRLPSVRTVVREVEPPQGGEPVGPSIRRRILVADDNVDSAESLGRLLELLGNEVRAANDGVQAVDVAAAFRPDVILLDIGMPKLNGYDACRRIREQPWGKQPLMIALTGWGQDEDKRRSQEAGFDRHMVKPVDPNALMKLLAELKAAKM